MSSRRSRTRPGRLIDEEATRVLKLKLAARKLVDFVGPLGPRLRRRQHRTADHPEERAGGRRRCGSLRVVVPTTELRTSFELSRAELDAVERGSENPDLDPLIEAATRIAAAEDNAVFHGYAPGGIVGIDEASTHPAQTISTDFTAYPHSVAEATRLLRIAGIDGPYAIALGPRCYAGLTQATGPGGFPVLEVVRSHRRRCRWSGRRR